MVVVSSISYTGLIVPKVVSIFKGDKIRGTLADTALFGAIFVLGCDVLGPRPMNCPSSSSWCFFSTTRVTGTKLSGSWEPSPPAVPPRPSCVEVKRHENSRLPPEFEKDSQPEVLSPHPIPKVQSFPNLTICHDPYCGNNLPRRLTDLH